MLAPLELSVPAADGLVLKGTLTSRTGGRPGAASPLAVLAHQYPATRDSFGPLARDLLAAGIRAADLSPPGAGHGVRQRPLGPAAPTVSSVGYGGMHLSIDGRPPEAQGIRVLHAALDAGVTLIDTADVYCLDQRDIGHNERLIAQALASWRGDAATVTVATKGGVVRPDGRWESDASPAQLRAACERSLRALEVERLALYQLHAPDPKVPFAAASASSPGCGRRARSGGSACRT